MHTTFVRKIHIHKNEKGLRKSHQVVKAGDAITVQDSSYGLEEFFTQFDQSINLQGDDSSDTELDKTRAEIQVEEKTKILWVSCNVYLL